MFRTAHAPVSLKLQQTRSESADPAQIKRLSPHLPAPVAASPASRSVFRQSCTDRSRQAASTVGSRDHLHRLAFHFGKGGAQRFMARDDLVQALLQRLRRAAFLAGARQTACCRQQRPAAVDRSPTALLGKRERQLPFARNRLNRCDLPALLPCLQRFDLLGQVCHSRASNRLRKRHLHAECLD